MDAECNVLVITYSFCAGCSSAIDIGIGTVDFSAVGGEIRMSGKKALSATNYFDLWEIIIFTLDIPNFF